ncbi:zinc-binding dehydrogenase [Microbacterium sp. W1N]|uniref:zinc-binding dehydrogenase n=1 Tax=Microbacterium festucae TaxID=2977531 RepID=UPI0021BE9E22|nr:zinc-binding dehydrogenase [Microbacterium festucae]MCT9820937.1 zinc-binding dehydrogenase [Microbacterium festucae]
MPAGTALRGAAYRYRFAPEAATAMVWMGQGRPFEAVAVLDIEFGPRDVLVEIELATVCGSDVHTIDGRRSSPAPSVLGHEYVGRVVAAGVDARLADGSRVQLRDRVVWSVTVSCGVCVTCRRGIPQKCVELLKYGHERFDGDWPLSGGFATHAHLRAGTAIVKVADHVAAEALAPVSCGVATAAAALAAAEQLHDLDDATVLVSGAGLIGLAAAALAADAGAHVVVVDPVPARRELALRFGAAAAVDPGRGSSARTVAAACDGGAPDVVIEASGSRRGVELALAAPAVGGTAVLVGSVFPDDPVGLDAERVVRGLLTVRGVHNYTAADLARAARFVTASERRMPWAELVGATLPLSDLAGAVALAQTGRHVRVAVRP